MLTSRAHKIALAAFLAVLGLWLLFCISRLFDYYSYHYIGYREWHANRGDSVSFWGHSDPGVTAATALLVIVGSIQIAVFLYQLKLIRQSLKPAQGAASAANLTAVTAREELLSTHRPKIRVKHFFLMNDIWQGEPIIVNLWCVNNGTSDAILGEIGIRYHVVRNDRVLPIDPRISAIPDLNLNGIRLPTGRNWEVPNINIGRILTPDENADIQQQRSKLYCVGYVSYLDGAGRMRITGFCRVLTFPPDAIAHIGNTRFRRFRDPDYEYED